MRVHQPSSRGYFRLRFSVFDLFWAALTPLLALYIRDAYILSAKGASLAILYCSISFAFSVIAILAFRLNEGISRYFSVHDALTVVKAVCAAGFMTAIFLFTFTRLEGIPRTTPVIHALILAAGLTTVRAFASLRDTDITQKSRTNHSQLENIILIGANDLSAFYIRFVRAYSPISHRIVGVLDERNTLYGRTLIGVPILANVQRLEHTIHELEVHGVRTHRIVVGGDETLLSKDALAHVRRVCKQQKLQLMFVPKLIGLGANKSNRTNGTTVLPEIQTPLIVAPYHKTKRLIDFVASGAAILILSPLFALISLLILFDIGSPVTFWQQRVGQGGSTFLLYKFRTLRAPFDRHGSSVSESQRISWIGRLLRKTRFDELPQLFNVLVGDMSLIGPRPLLPRDQPANHLLRLAVRPGMTGWAQVKGGNLVTSDEKGALDDWYVRHASPWVDLSIIGSTLLFLIRGERRSEVALNQAFVEQTPPQPSQNLPVPRQSVVEEIGPALRRAAALKVKRRLQPAGKKPVAETTKPRQGSLSLD